MDPDGNPYNVDLGWFFDQWIRGSGIPQYKFNYDTRQAEDGSWIVEGNIEQRVVIGGRSVDGVIDDTYYRGVTFVTVKSKKEDYRSRVVIQGKNTPFQFKVPEKPQDIVLNESHSMLAHDVLTNKNW